MIILVMEINSKEINRRAKKKTYGNKSNGITTVAEEDSGSEKSFALTYNSDNSNMRMVFKPLII